MDIDRKTIEGDAIEAAYGLCLNAVHILAEARLAFAAYMLRLAIVAILEANQEAPAAV